MIKNTSFGRQDLECLQDITIGIIKHKNLGKLIHQQRQKICLKYRNKFTKMLKTYIRKIYFIKNISVKYLLLI